MRAKVNCVFGRRKAANGTNPIPPNTHNTHTRIHAHGDNLSSPSPVPAAWLSLCLFFFVRFQIFVYLFASLLRMSSHIFLFASAPVISVTSSVSCVFVVRSHFGQIWVGTWRAPQHAAPPSRNMVPAPAPTLAVQRIHYAVVCVLDDCWQFAPP